MFITRCMFFMVMLSSFGIYSSDDEGSDDEFGQFEVLDPEIETLTRGLCRSTIGLSEGERVSSGRTSSGIASVLMSQGNNVGDRCPSSLGGAVVQQKPSAAGAVPLSVQLVLDDLSSQGESGRGFLGQTSMGGSTADQGSAFLSSVAAKPLILKSSVLDHVSSQDGSSDCCAYGFRREQTSKGESTIAQEGGDFSSSVVAAKPVVLQSSLLDGIQSTGTANTQRRILVAKRRGQSSAGGSGDLGLTIDLSKIKDTKPVTPSTVAAASVLLPLEGGQVGSLSVAGNKRKVNEPLLMKQESLICGDDIIAAPSSVKRHAIEEKRNASKAFDCPAALLTAVNTKK